MEWRVKPPNADGTTRVIGIDLGPVKPIWWESFPYYSSGKVGNGSTIVLKIPGSTQWASRGEMKYYGAYFQVLRVLRIDDYGNFVCETIIDFPLRSK